jgi:hypothetical protein
VPPLMLMTLLMRALNMVLPQRTVATLLERMLWQRSLPHVCPLLVWRVFFLHHVLEHIEAQRTDISHHCEFYAWAHNADA